MREAKKREHRLRARERRSKRRLSKQEAYARAEANASHKTYQSPRETEKKGWMKQHIVNKVLSLWGDR